MAQKKPLARPDGDMILNALIQVFADICVLRKGPQDLPTSSFLFGVTAMAYLLIGVINMSVELSWPATLTSTLIDMALMGGLLYLALWVKQTTPRWVQAMTAFFGAGAFLGFVATPLVFWYQAAGSGTPAAIFPSISLLGILVWQMFVIAGILRHALSVPLIFGGASAALYLYINLRILNALFFTPE